MFLAKSAEAMARPSWEPSADATRDVPTIFQPTHPPAREARDAKQKPTTRGVVVGDDDDDEASLLVVDSDVDSFGGCLRLLVVPPNSAPRRIRGVAYLIASPWRLREVAVPPGERTPTLASKKVSAMAVTGAPNRRPALVVVPRVWAKTPTAERVARFPQESSAPTRLLREVVVAVVVVVLLLLEMIVVVVVVVVLLLERDCGCCLVAISIVLVFDNADGQGR